MSVPFRVPSVLSVAMVCAFGSTQAGESYRFAHDQNFPPFAYVENGKSVGMAVDILQAAIQHGEVELTFVPVAFPEIQPSLMQGKVNAIFPLAINDERRKTMDFSDPLLMTGGAIFVRAPEQTPATLAELSGKTVVTPKTGPLAGYIQRTAPDIRLVVTADYDESLAQLMSGEADAAALNFQVGARLANQKFPGKITAPEQLFLELPLAVAVRKGEETDLLHRINRGLLQANRDGSVQAIKQRWLEGD